jgi:hypothetical protein
MPATSRNAPIVMHGARGHRTSCLAAVRVRALASACPAPQPRRPAPREPHAFASLSARGGGRRAQRDTRMSFPPRRSPEAQRHREISVGHARGGTRPEVPERGTDTEVAWFLLLVASPVLHRLREQLPLRPGHRRVAQVDVGLPVGRVPSNRVPGKSDCTRPKSVSAQAAELAPSASRTVL